MTAQDILDAMNAHLALFPGQGEIAWEGDAYEPRNGVPYLKPSLSSYTKTGVAAGIQGAAQHDGTYTISVRRPADEGRALAGQLAGALAGHFNRGAVLNTADGLPVILLQSTEGVAQSYGNWMTLPVTVTFTATS